MMTPIMRYFLPLSVILLMLSSCQVTRQTQLASNLANCDFRLRSAEQVNLAGVDFEHVRSISDLGFSDMAKILAGFGSPVFPLSMQLRIEGRNPNAKPAGLNRLEWILFIDDIQMTSGVVDEPFVIPPNGSAIIPVQVALDLKTVLTGKSAEAIINFCLNLAGSALEPTRIKIKLKPVIMVGGTALQYPGYITVRTTYSGE